MSFEELNNLKIKELGKFLEYCDTQWNIPMTAIMNTRLFDSVAEAEVFFFSYDGIYYNTDVALLRRLDELYVGTLDECNINRLFFID